MTLFWLLFINKNECCKKRQLLIACICLDTCLEAQNPPLSLLIGIDVTGVDKITVREKDKSTDFGELSDNNPYLSSKQFRYF